ncbi:MAG: SCO family protein [Phycisphaerae bacterium]|nr:SCO family protein [Phycisphaerae bacterium]
MTANPCRDPGTDASASRRAALRTLLLPAGVVAFGGGAGLSRIAAGASQPREAPFGQARIESDGTRTFRNVELHDQDGRRVRFHDDLVRDRIFAATFGYALCPGICRRMADNMRAASELLGPIMGDPVSFYSFSLAEDTPSRLREEMERRGIYGRPGWRYLTGPTEAIREIRWSFGFYDAGEEDTLGSPGTHTAMVRFGNHRLDSWNSCPSLAPPETIAASVVWLFPSCRRPSLPAVDRLRGSGAQRIPGFVPPAPLVAQR